MDQTCGYSYSLRPSSHQGGASVKGGQGTVGSPVRQSSLGTAQGICCPFRGAYRDNVVQSNIQGSCGLQSWASVQHRTQ